MVIPAGYLDVIKDQTRRTLWSLHNVMDCIPDSKWCKLYCGMPLWKHIYHTLHSLDKWYINPYIYDEPDFHREGLNDLDIKTGGLLTRDLLKDYAFVVENKINEYLSGLTDYQLLEKPPQCPYTRFHLILAQHRHIDMHIGIIMGYIMVDSGKWPKVLGLLDTVKTRHEPEYY